MASHSLPTFNVLSIGHRGVGKTVFLAGSYAELQSGRQVQAADIWFEGQDEAAQHNLHNLLAYVARTGHYPPATMKTTSFNFSAHTQHRRQKKVLCHFHWSDIPGEICRLDHPDFEPMVLNSHGCCAFIDANALVHEPDYLSQIEDTIKQIEIIASLANQSGLPYIFALILTKCDLLSTGPAKLLKIEQQLQPLTTRLSAINASYRRFYSSIPIVQVDGTPTLKAEGASLPLLWLIAELSKNYGHHTPKDLASGFNQVLSPSPSANTLSLKEQPGLGRSWWARPLPLLGAGLLSLGALLGLGWGVGLFSSPQTSQSPPGTEPAIQRIRTLETAITKNPQDEQALAELATLYEDTEQYALALKTTEQQVALRPQDINLHFQVAGLQSLLGRSDLQEKAYDRILAIEGNNVMALTQKAILRSSVGDLGTAQQLFTKAEKSVPEGAVKDTIRDIAQQWLGSKTTTNSN